MIQIVVAVVWIVTAAGVGLVACAAPRRVPSAVGFVLLGIAEAAILVGVTVDVLLLARGWTTPDLPTHLGYLISLPFIPLAGLALTYRKIDRWGMLILGIATLIGAIMVVRQLQTLGLPFGYLNVRGA